MPLRRRPAEPSPRLLALLAGPDQGAVEAQASGAEDQAEAEGFWLPRREWLEERPATAGHRRGREEATQPHPNPSAPGEAPARGHRAPPGRHRRPRPPGPALLSVPVALRGARVTGPAAAAVGMVVVVLLAVGVFGVRVAWARAASAPEPVVAGAGTSAPSALVSRTPGAGVPGDAVSPSSRPSSPPSGAGGAGRLVVHVVGQVRRPGVVVLSPGARVGEALTRAGGALPGADLGALNLARALVDGEQVRVPKPGEAAPAAAEAPGGAGAAGSGGAASGTAGSALPVNLNTATVAVLEELPGVGPVLAQRIVDWRTEHGRFTSVDELAEVSGIGEKMFAQLQGKVTV